MRPVHRLTPRLPSQAMKTYHIARPAPTHFRKADCREVECAAWRNGWTTVIDVARAARAGLPSGGDQANYIRLHSGRHYTHTQTGTLVTFRFPPGQQCFTAHQVPVGREPVFAVTGGDWRGNPRGTAPVRFRSPRQFVDDFAEHQSRLADRMKRG
jgi:hypothetical protein